MKAKLTIALVVAAFASGLAYWLGYRQGAVTCGTRWSQYYQDEARDNGHRNGSHQAWICLEALKDLNAGKQAQATAVLEQHLNEGLLRFLSGWHTSQGEQFAYPQILLLRDAREHRRQRPWTNAEPDEVERLEKAFKMLDAPDKVKLLERIDEVFKPAQPDSAANRGQPFGSVTNRAPAAAGPGG